MEIPKDEGFFPISVFTDKIGHNNNNVEYKATVFNKAGASNVAFETGLYALLLPVLSKHI